MASSRIEGSARTHVLTVSVEEYFHAQVFRGTVSVKRWDYLESRLKTSIQDILEFLAPHGAKATFFVLGWTAERQPDLVRSILAAGHEVASRGYWPRGARGMVPEAFRADLRRAKRVLEDAGSNRICGFRSPHWITAEEIWILDVLAEEGYLYDSSINPVLRRFAADPRRFEVHRHRHSASDLALWEFPISTVSVLGLRLAISGGNYVRQFPHSILRHAVARWSRTKDSPLVFYFMPWEMDLSQPHIGSISFVSRVRHYRNLAKTRWVLADHFSRYAFQSIADYLGVREERSPGRPDRAPGIEATTDRNDATLQEAAEPVTVVVPLYNERQNIGYLRRTLEGLRRRLADRYRVAFCLVDDGSTDGTWPEVGARFAGTPDVITLRHSANRGVAAAILTGLRAAPTETVCSIDCDCSYDPSILEQMIPLLNAADLVTASPYHPDGSTFNVPPWRLFLSRTLSRIYSLLLSERVYTFTSCCRVYRKSVMTSLTLEYDDFLGVAELLIRAKLAGARIVEYPATLEARLFGESKMKTLRTIRRHLGLVLDLAFHRWRGSSKADR